MLFSRIVSCFAFVFTLGALVVATPAPVDLEERQAANTVESIVDSLKSQSDRLVPQIKNAAASPSANSAQLENLVKDLVLAIESAQSSVSRVGPVRLKNRATNDAVAAKISTVVKDIAGVVKIIPIGFPSLTFLIFSLDFAIAKLISSLNVTLFGVGLLVGGLLNGVVGLLSGLGFGLTLGLLGLKF